MDDEKPLLEHMIDVIAAPAKKIVPKKKKSKAKSAVKKATAKKVAKKKRKSRR